MDSNLKTTNTEEHGMEQWMQMENSPFEEEDLPVAEKAVTLLSEDEEAELAFLAMMEAEEAQAEREAAGKEAA